MRFEEFNKPVVGDIVEVEIGDSIVETVIVAITEDEIVCETDNLDAVPLLEAAPALVRGAAGLATGGLAAIGTPVLMSMFGPLLGLGLGVAGAYNASKMAMSGVDELWDMVAKKLGGEDNAEAFGMAHARAAAQRQPEFEFGGKTYKTELKPQQAQQAAQAVKSMGESRQQGVAEDDEAIKAFLAKGGEIQYGKTHKPRKGERWQGSSHIGAAGGKGTKGQVSGLGANTKTNSGKPVVTAGQYSDDENNPVVNAITRRIMLQRHDLLAKYGPEKVGNAIDDVADFVGDVDEIGSSDVSSWVRQVEQQLGSMTEAEYQGREVKLGKPMQGDVKKFKVYVRNPKTGKTIKVNFGDPNMRIKKSNPARRKSFRARHHCANPGPRTKARYWSCRKW